MSKSRMIGIVCVGTVILCMIIQFTHLPNGLSNSIRGSFIEEGNKRNFISFDSNTTGEVIYYYINENGKQVEEKGIFEKLKNGHYKIEIKSIRTESARLEGIKLIIEVNGQQHTFMKESDIPSVIITE